MPQENPARRRVAWILVISMSVLLALAFLGVIFGFMRQSRIMTEGRQTAPVAAAPAGNALASLTLAPGVRIVSARTEAGKLVLHLTGSAGDEVQVIDLATGALTQQVRTQPAQ